MSHSYKDEASHVNKEQPPKKKKRQFNKKVRQSSKKVLEDYIAGVAEEEELEQWENNFLEIKGD